MSEAISMDGVAGGVGSRVERPLAELVRLGGTPAEVAEQREMVRLFLPLLRADFELNETYRPMPGRPALTCPVHAFSGDRDPLAEPQEVGGRREVTSGHFRLRVLPGGHFYLKDSEEFVAALRSCLTTVRTLHH